MRWAREDLQRRGEGYPRLAGQLPRFCHELRGIRARTFGREPGVSVRRLERARLSGDVREAAPSAKSRPRCAVAPGRGFACGVRMLRSVLLSVAVAALTAC